MNRSLVLLIILAFASRPGLHGQKRPSLEPFPDLTFPTVVWNGRGPGRISELRGYPVLVVFTDLGREGAGVAPSLLQQAERHLGGQGIETLLWQVRPRRDLATEVLTRWPRLRATVVVGGPGKDAGISPIPEAVVIGYDGRTVYRGPCAKPDQGPNPVARIRTAILEDLARRKSGWGASSAMRSARSLIWHHGTLAAARQRLLRHTPSPPTQDDYDRCLGELELAFKNRLRRIRTDTADGRWLRAQAAGAQLAADSKGWETREDVALEAMRSLSAPSARAHFVLERKLEDVLRGVRARGPRARDANLLRRMLRSTPAGAVQDRVKRWIAWIDAAATRRGR